MNSGIGRGFRIFSPDEQMTEDDIQDWLQMLGRTRGHQVRVVRDLLEHARGDQMTPEDLRVCRMALRRLEGLE